MLITVRKYIESTLTLASMMLAITRCHVVIFGTVSKILTPKNALSVACFEVGLVNKTLSSPVSVEQ